MCESKPVITVYSRSDCVQCTMTKNIDEILATGQYTDRRGRRWHVSHYGMWMHAEAIVPVLGVRYATRQPCEMRLLIERDQHRDECEGLDSCITHPVPHVIAGRAHAGQFAVYGRGPGRMRPTLTEALDAARALAVGP